MKEIKTTADIANATAIDLGPLAKIKDYVLELGPGVKIPGKVFGGAAIKAGGADFSLQVFAPGTEGGFYHTHKEHEELYFFLSGEGEYQVDGTNIPVREGSVVRVSPAGKRTVRNTGSTPRRVNGRNSFPRTASVRVSATTTTTCADRSRTIRSIPRSRYMKAESGPLKCRLNS